MTGFDFLVDDLTFYICVKLPNRSIPFPLHYSTCRGCCRTEADWLWAGSQCASCSRRQGKAALQGCTSLKAGCFGGGAN